jgi:DHA2 family multidrug resistance protein
VTAAVMKADAPVAAGGVNPWLIAILVALASFMEVLDTTIANVALPYIAGGMGVSVDEASWVVTTYLVANAIILTASSYLARRFGRKPFFLICLSLFTVSSLLCGFAPNLNALLMCRVLQGVAGGGMVPVAQSILADSFPPAKRAQAFAVFGIAVVVAPVVGPTLGGWISDNISWKWCFLINVPVGAFATAAIAMVLPGPAAGAQRQPQPQKRIGFDVVGFVLIATFLGALEIVLDRGLEDDWFGSSFIVTSAAICALAFALMIPWELNHPNPAVDLRMIATRQFGACFVVMALTGAILLATTQFLPQLVQGNFGYTATWAGLVLSPGGAVTLATMLVVGRIAGKIQPKYLIIAGATIIAISMYGMTNVYSDLDYWFIARLHGRVLRRHRSVQNRPSLGDDQCGAQHGLVDRRRNRLERAGASRAIPPEPARRASDAIEHGLPNHLATGDELFLCERRLTGAGARSGHPMDRRAGWGAGVLPCLYGCVLGADAALAFRHSARPQPAQSEARRSR